MIVELLDQKERRQFYLLIGLTIVMGVLDVVGVAAILPFLAVVSDPSTIKTNDALRVLHETLNDLDVRDFMILLGLGAFFFVLFSTAVRTLTLYALTYFTRMRTLSLASRLLKKYLSQPYTWFLTRHTSDLGKSVLSEVAQVVNGPIASAMQLIAQSVTVAFLAMFLFFLEPAAALGAVVLLGGSYGLIFWLARKKLTHMGQDRIEANREKFQIMQEALGGIKTVKLTNLERSYLVRFYGPASRLARSQAALAIISELPRHLLEVVAFGGMILFVLWLLLTSDGQIGGIVPILGVYAVAGARLFPAIQKLFGAMSGLRFGRPVLQQMHSELADADEGDIDVGANMPAISLNRRLEIDDVSFSFPGTTNKALEGLTMAIDAYTTVGIVGATGAGKTTTVDLILGLLLPLRGEIRVDGEKINMSNVRAWQKSVGYVPQEIFLVDDTISANIAFGVSSEKIDRDAVEAAAKVAELHDFVIGELPKDYDTMVGERGTRLSGGQRQRIGIARALYNDPDILIFDEATSALDSLTEKAVMDAIGSIGQTKTIVLIAHRLSTVRNCDTIFMLERGRVTGSGSYAQLVEQNERFRALHEATTSRPL